jgi:hypothetical protein
MGPSFGARACLYCEDGVFEEASDFSVAFTIYRFGRVAQLVRALA